MQTEERNGWSQLDRELWEVSCEEEKARRDEHGRVWNEAYAKGVAVGLKSKGTAVEKFLT